MNFIIISIQKEGRNSGSPVILFNILKIIGIHKEAHVI